MSGSDSVVPPSRDDTDRRFLPRASPGRRADELDRARLFGSGSGPDERARDAKPLVHFVILLTAFLAGLSFIVVGNVRFAPLLFYTPAIEAVARTLATGVNYATFDLNIESRALRNAHIANLSATPDVAVLGASHWQEAHGNLVPEIYFYNAHVHRDYYQDMLAVVEMFLRNNRLPKQIILTIRDNLFTPVAERTDYLWTPTMPYYRAMARRLELPAPSWTEGLPLPQIREAISLFNLRTNIGRWLNATALPHATTTAKDDTLDILLPDGSIKWSREHDALFTAERARSEALAFAALRRNDPPRIDPLGVMAIERLLSFLKDRDVEVILAHPPFNPTYYDALQGSPYMIGLARIEALTRRLADTFGLSVIGAFNPKEVGCGVEMYIDAEHSNPLCLQKVLDQYRALNRPGATLSDTAS